MKKDILIDRTPELLRLKIIARVYNDFSSKFGLPRQSGLSDSIESKIIFEPEYRNSDSVRGLEEFSHLWLLWLFSDGKHQGWSPTVRPPRLGGNVRMGVFATRSPNRPNPVGLSAVRLKGIVRHHEYGNVLIVSGTDMMNNTPVIDIKPYLPYTDSITDANGGFTDRLGQHRLQVAFPDAMLDMIPAEKRKTLLDILQYDPRPAYQEDNERVYGLTYAGFNVRFTIDGNKITICEVERE